MGVKNYYGSSAYDPSVVPRVPLPAEETQGHIKELTGTTEVANGDSATSTIAMGNVPSTARLTPSRIYTDAIAGNTSVSVGDAAHPTALLNAADLHTGGAVGAGQALTGIDIANINKPLWSLLGYADDPGGEIMLIITLGNALTAAGTISWSIGFKTP